MFLHISVLLLIISPAMSKPHYVELDEDDQELLRNAYDTPSYEEDCEDDDDLQTGKIDLIKDGVWALKAKVKELKAFNKALTANLLLTKQKLKELVMKKGLTKNNNYGVPAKKKQYPYEMYVPQYPQYAGIPYAHDPYIGI